MATADDRRETDSGIEVKPVYTEKDVERSRARASPANSRSYWTIRGSCIAVRPWTMRQYAGFATAEATNERFRYLLYSRGQTGLSMVFHLPTQLGLRQ